MTTHPCDDTSREILPDIEQGVEIGGRRREIACDEVRLGARKEALALEPQELFVDGRQLARPVGAQFPRMPQDAHDPGDHLQLIG
jgi:hypothetical protein